MKITSGFVTLCKMRVTEFTSSQQPTKTNAICSLCFSSIDKSDSMKGSCVNSLCQSRCHLTCLAREFLESGQYIPINGQCPDCRHEIIWGDLIRKRNGCSDSTILIDDSDEN